jgi:alcohol dehydrogenase (cytochrome c)
LMRTRASASGTFSSRQRWPRLGFTEAVILVDRMWHGQNRKLLLHADRNAMFYVLDRTTGSFSRAQPSRIRTGTAASTKTAARRWFQTPTRALRAVSLCILARRWNEFPGAFLQSVDRMVLSGVRREWSKVCERARHVRAWPAVYRTGTGGAQQSGANDPPPSAGIKALDPETGKTVGTLKSTRDPEQWSHGNGRRRTLRRDARRESGRAGCQDGKYLWRFQTGSNMAASPMSYAVDGKQYIAVAAWRRVYAFALPE